MHLKQDYRYWTIWNVIGKIPGTKYPDQWVVLGNHRDAWVYGAVDPNSGTAAMLETVHGFAELLQAGLGGDLNESGQEYVKDILTSVGRLGEQIESVLDLSQSEAGMLPLANEEIELLPFVTALAEDRAARIKAGEITLDLRGVSFAQDRAGSKQRDITWCAPGSSGPGGLRRTTHLAPLCTPRTR